MRLVFAFLLALAAAYYDPALGLLVLANVIPCCCCQCLVFADSFDGEDDTDLGANWSEEDGDWERSGSKLITSDADALLTCLATGATAGALLTFQADVKASASGDQLRYVNGGAYVEVEFGTGKLRHWRKNQISGALPYVKSREADITAAVDTSYTLRVTYGKTTGTHSLPTVSVYWDGELIFQDTSYPAGSGDHGLATGDLTGTATFDNVSFTKSAHELACCPTSSHCVWPNVWPQVQQIQAVVESTSASGNCSAGKCTEFEGTHILDKGVSAGADFSDLFDAAAFNGDCLWWLDLDDPVVCTGATYTRMLFINRDNQGTFNHDALLKFGVFIANDYPGSYPSSMFSAIGKHILLDNATDAVRGTLQADLVWNSGSGESTSNGCHAKVTLSPVV